MTGGEYNMMQITYALDPAAHFRNPVEGSLESWAEMVRDLAFRTRGGGEHQTSDVISLRDIPFHFAFTWLCPSDRHWMQMMLSACHRRQFFLTDAGYMGLAPETARVGDLVNILVPGRIPFVFSDVHEQAQQEQRKMRLIGDCYLDPLSQQHIMGTPEPPERL